MTILSLIISNLRYYRKPYLAILAGTIISTAVLTGALVLGDSVLYSLGQLTDIRLGNTRFALNSGDRFFRQGLAKDLSLGTKSPAAPVLRLEGIAVNTDKNRQINRVEVLGIDENFMAFWNTTTPKPSADEAVLSRNAAEKLNLKPGDEFLLKIHKKAKAPENAPFVSEKEQLAVFRLKVGAIADDQQMGRFSLKSNQSAPYNIFLPLSTLADKAGLSGNANLILIAGDENKGLTTKKVDSMLRLSWQPEDAGLSFRNIPGSKTGEIRSDRIFIEDITAKAIKITFPEAEAILTYLVNAISTKSKSTPYSFVTAAAPGYLGSQLSGQGIIINNWLASDLNVHPGDSLTLRYFKMGPFRKLTQDSARFCIKAILPLSDPLFDRTLMPDFPGMSDAGNCRDWETGAPIDLSDIRDKDEKYWNEFRGTPKAFISMAAGEVLWNNPFGRATAFRFPADSSALNTFSTSLMHNLDPAENGLRIQDVYGEGKAAAANSTNFGELFLSLGFFIILAALLLTALLFSLLAQKRMAETAILAALGFSKKKIIRILFLEVLLVVVAGSILGAISGIFYNKLMLLGLNTLWQDAVRTSMLQMHLLPGTLFTGLAAGAITALLTLLFVLFRNLRKPLSIMVKGIDIPSPGLNILHKRISLSIAIVSFGSAIAIMMYSYLKSPGDLSLPFLSAGGMILIAGIAFLYAMMLHAGRKTISSSPGFYLLILKNISLKKGRTITAVALLALGTFSVIITGANRKTFYGTENSRHSGTGGFLFWAETTIPLLYDLNSPSGKEKYGLNDEPVLNNVRFVQMLRLDGNDASCLNLNQVSQPAILGVNAAMFDQQQSFDFLQLEPSVDVQHPWLALSRALAPGIIAAYADQTVIQWGMRKKIGDTLLYLDEAGKVLRLKIMGGLDNSIFQGNILISDALFRQYFPAVGGSKVMLINGAFSQRSQISGRLDNLFQDYGLVAVPASERLAQFNSVENTYLSVFMLLGGLGMLIGTIGLGIVILQNLLGRKQEFALYVALGFKHNFIMKLIFTENMFILLSGLGIGLLASFAGILPSFFSAAFQFPALFLLIIMLFILLSGSAWIYFPVKAFLRKNLSSLAVPQIFP